MGEEGRAEEVRSARTGRERQCVQGKKGQQGVGGPREGDAAQVLCCRDKVRSSRFIQKADSHLECL